MELNVGGIYEHVKTGNHYKVIAVVKNSETLEELVIYEALYDNQISKIWARPRESFTGEAKSPDGTLHPRFRLISKAF